MDVKFLVMVLPLVFMFHDFEEIIMFKPWIQKNREEIHRRFPRFDSMLGKNHDKLSTSGYAIAVLHEFTVITLITCLCVYFNSYHWWFGAFAAFSIHLLVHIGQWIVFRRYVPVIITSILALPYCAFTFREFLRINDMTTGQMLIWTFVGIVITIASFFPAFFLASRFESWKNKTYLGSENQ